MEIIEINNELKMCFSRYCACYDHHIQFFKHEPALKNCYVNKESLLGSIGSHQPRISVVSKLYMILS